VQPPASPLFCCPTSIEVLDVACWRCILVHQTCSLHFSLDLIMELTRH
jgi:hypothetical protein